MKCQHCGCSDSRVVDSRPTEEGGAIRRRRECMKCLRRFTTYEKIEIAPIMVVKKDECREPFDPAKIKKGLILACRKRPVSIKQMDAIVQAVEKQAQLASDDEITSYSIGEIVMEKLRTIDEVSYVRFASVYRQFADVSSFMEELEKLREKL